MDSPSSPTQSIQSVDPPGFSMSTRHLTEDDDYESIHSQPEWDVHGLTNQHLQFHNGLAIPTLSGSNGHIGNNNYLPSSMHVAPMSMQEQVAMGNMLNRGVELDFDDTNFDDIASRSPSMASVESSQIFIQGRPRAPSPGPPMTIETKTTTSNAAVMSGDHIPDDDEEQPSNMQEWVYDSEKSRTFATDSISDDSSEKDIKQIVPGVLCLGCWWSWKQCCYFWTGLLLALGVAVGMGIWIGRAPEVIGAGGGGANGSSLPPVSLTATAPTNPPSSAPPTSSPAPSSTEHPTYTPLPPSKFTVGAYYYPWHGPDFHRGDGYVRKEIGHTPALGEYDDRDPAVISQHLEWSRQANIRAWITSWWGPDSREDLTTKNHILTHPELKDHKIALFYETTGRLRDRDTSNVVEDMRYIANTYFDHPNYLRINDRPVLVIYVTRVLEDWEDGILEEALLLMRSTMASLGHNLYLIGDQAFGSPPSGDLPILSYLDAVSNYDVYGSINRVNYATQAGVDGYIQDQQGWKDQAALQKCDYVPGVSPGFNDRGVRLEVDHKPLSRQLTMNSEHGTLFRELLRQSLPMTTESTDNLILVNSFNEWHEDSQIEPAMGNPTAVPLPYTNGVEYIGYDTLYLDILGEMTFD